MFMAASPITERWEQPKSPLMDERADKICYRHAMEYDSTKNIPMAILFLKKERNSDTCYNTDEPLTFLDEIKQSQKDKY